MDDLHTILARHLPKNKKSDELSPKNSDHHLRPSVSEIPDLFFDQILVDYKLTRIEIVVLMYLYRKVWCRPNLYKEFGIGPMISFPDMCEQLKLSRNEIYQSIRKLESLNFIETIRTGQYFVRKYFTEENDIRYGMSYEDF